MFALVQFSDESYYVCKIQDVVTKNKQTTVRYKGSRFAAKVITVNGKKQDLLTLKETLENENPDDGEIQVKGKLKEKLENQNTSDGAENEAKGKFQEKFENQNPNDKEENYTKGKLKEELENENPNDDENEMKRKLKEKLENENLYGEENKAMPNARTKQPIPSKNSAVNESGDDMPLSRERGIPIVVEDKPVDLYKLMTNNGPTKVWHLSHASGNSKTMQNTSPRKLYSGAEIEDTSLVATANLLSNANQSMLEDLFGNTGDNGGLNDLQCNNDDAILPRALANSSQYPEPPAVYANLESTPIANLDPYLGGKANTSLEDLLGSSFSFRAIQEVEDELNVAVVQNESDNGDIGSEYSPDVNASDESSDEQTDFPNTSKSNHTSIHENAAKSSSAINSVDSPHIANTVGHSAPDDQEMFVTTVESGTKTDYCLYCNKMQAKLSRHIIRKHRAQEEVAEYLSYPSGSVERKKLMASIRKKSNFVFNTDRNLNTGERKGTRRPTEKSKKTAIDYATCPSCLGDYAKDSLRHHVRRCQKKSTGKRDILIGSRKITGRIHREASNALRQNVFPTMQDDEVVRAIRYDELIIRFGNKLCQKYRGAQDYDMVRQKLRQLGRFLREIKKHVKDISNFFDVFLPKNYNASIIAVQSVAGLNESQTGFRAPSLATSLGTLLKQVGNLCISEYIKQQNKEKQTLAEDYLKLLVEDYPMSITRTVLETNAQQLRQKKVTLPSIEDITKLQDYLRTELEKNYAALEQEFSLSAWLNMGSCILVLLQLFNRRRPGETERILIKDFENYEKIDYNNIGEEYKKFSIKEKAAAQKYVRFVIRGKLNRTVPVLMHRELLLYTQRLLSLRNLAKVDNNNPYVFGIPGRVGGHFKYFRSCELIRRYANECGAAKPETLRATVLRKHVATVCAHINLTDSKVSDLANFMGHADKIHRTHYRQSAIARDILHVSKLLEIVQGKDFDYDDGSDSGEEMNSEIPTVANIDKESNRQVIATPSRLDSTIQSVADSDVASKRRKTRSTSPYGRCKRVRWTIEEKNIILKEFKESIETKKLPSLKEIQAVVDKHQVFRKRNLASIKTWISNQIKKKA